MECLQSFLRRHLAGNQCWRRGEISAVFSGYKFPRGKSLNYSQKLFELKKRFTSRLFLTLVLSISATAAQFLYLTHLRKHSIIRLQ